MNMETQGGIEVDVQEKGGREIARVLLVFQKLALISPEDPIHILPLNSVTYPLYPHEISFDLEYIGFG